MVLSCLARGIGPYDPICSRMRTFPGQLQLERRNFWNCEISQTIFSTSWEHLLSPFHLWICLTQTRCVQRGPDVHPFDSMSLNTLHIERFLFLPLWVVVVNVITLFYQLKNCVFHSLLLSSYNLTEYFMF